ncbi:Uncharacterised protein [Vibrio cholerae]|nr:Uncharacterised protein [Vibrio cholerae]
MFSEIVFSSAIDSLTWFITLPCSSIAAAMRCELS